MSPTGRILMIGAVLNDWVARMPIIYPCHEIPTLSGLIDSVFRGCLGSWVLAVVRLEKRDGDFDQFQDDFVPLRSLRGTCPWADHGVSSFRISDGVSMRFSARTTPLKPAISL